MPNISIPMAWKTCRGLAGNFGVFNFSKRKNHIFKIYPLFSTLFYLPVQTLELWLATCCRNCSQCACGARFGARPNGLLARFWQHPCLREPVRLESRICLSLPASSSDRFRLHYPCGSVLSASLFHSVPTGTPRLCCAT